MKPSLYLETTIASYLAARPSRDVIALARQQITQAWWQTRRGDFRLRISQLVLDEAQRGDVDASSRRQAFLQGLPLLDAVPEAFRLASVFLRPGLMPSRAKDDALHLALCAVHHVSYLLTWNFRHLANAETREGIRVACERAGYPLPTIATPDEMLKGAL